MENKPNYLLIGSFVVAGLAVFFATMIWLVRSEFDVEYVEYEILISGSVSGLSVGGDVRFNGIPVGQVRSIGIYENNVHLVQVVVTIDDSVPITIDAVAKLEVQGLTGVSYIEVSGGVSTELLAPSDEQRYGRITSEPSTIQNLMANIPAALGDIRGAAEQVTHVLSPQNQELLTELLANLVTITGDVAAVSHETAQNFNAASIRAIRITAEAEQLFSSASAFSAGSLPEISSLVADLRRLTSVLNSVATDFDQSAAETIFGSNIPEYQSE